MTKNEKRWYERETPVTKRVRFAAGVRALRKKPEVIALTEILIEEAKQAQ
ncbi:MAG: hypothetical protein V3V85_06180 [Candidatus Thorarchaeota archaeon]